jgi:hypothetical protein
MGSSKHGVVERSAVRAAGKLFGIKVTEGEGIMYRYAAHGPGRMEVYSDCEACAVRGALVDLLSAASCECSEGRPGVGRPYVPLDVNALRSMLVELGDRFLAAKKESK